MREPLKRLTPKVPGTTVTGVAEVQWLDGERFLIFRARNDHPDFPDSQRLTVTFEDDDNTMAERSKLSYDNETWQDDPKITFRRSQTR